MPLRVHSASFLRTAVRAKDWPPGRTPEVAFVGRSNVGKSSMLNALAARPGLARVSATPGRTQALQFFEVEVQASGAAPRRRIRLTDLPGYGYAKVPLAEKDRWRTMIEEYLRERDVLRGVVLIVDARHPPQASDHDAYAFLASTGRRVVVAATKMDKLARTQRSAALRRTEEVLALPGGDAVPFSAMERTGTEPLWARILEATA